jgi:hypothetical protein
MTIRVGNIFLKIFFTIQKYRPLDPKNMNECYSKCLDKPVSDNTPHRMKEEGGWQGAVVGALAGRRRQAGGGRWDMPQSRDGTIC